MTDLSPGWTKATFTTNGARFDLRRNWVVEHDGLPCGRVGLRTGMWDARDRNNELMDTFDSMDAAMRHVAHVYIAEYPDRIVRHGN